MSLLGSLSSNIEGLRPLEATRPFIFNEAIYPFLTDTNLAAAKGISKFFSHTIQEYSKLFLYTTRPVCRIQNRPIQPADLEFLWNKTNSSSCTVKTQDRIRVAVLTCNKYNQYKEDDRGIAHALEQVGVIVKHVNWKEKPTPNWKEFDAVIIKSPWDYSLPGEAEKFISVLESIEKLGVVLFNPRETIAWNYDKKYIQQLSKLGIPCIDTVWLSGANLDTLGMVMQQNNWSECVIKPSISGGGANTHRFTRENLNSIITQCKATGITEWMVQPFIKSVVEEGEYNVTVVGGVPFGVVRQTPKKGGFLVQFLHGGSVTRYKTPPEDVVKQVSAIFKQISDLVPEARFKDTLIVRIDVVRGPEPDSKFLLGEAEAIEPYSFGKGTNMFARRVVDVFVDRMMQKKRLFAISMEGDKFDFIQTQLSRFGEKLSVLHSRLSYRPVEHAMSLETLERTRQHHVASIEDAFPKTIKQYTTSISYSNVNEMQKTIVVIAESLSSIYSEFLIQEIRVKRSKENVLKDLVKYPDLETVAKFKAELKKFIIFKLNRVEEYHSPNVSQIYISTGLFPEGFLLEILNKSGISKENFEMEDLFPKMTSTIITRRSDLQTIKVEMTNAFDFISSPGYPYPKSYPSKFAFFRQNRKLLNRVCKQISIMPESSFN